MADANIVEGEVIDEHHTASIVHQPAPTNVTLWGTDDPAEIVDKTRRLASALTEVIESQELYSEISGRRFVKVEGWTLLGSMVGVYPVVVNTRKVTDSNDEWAEPVREDRPCPDCNGTGKFGSYTHRLCNGTGKARVVVDGGRGGWEATVEARKADGSVLGRADAECRWSEPNWSGDDSYALRSMAQTRATSKALRMPLDFIVRLAGFASTPAEEMQGRGSPAQVTSEHSCPHCKSPVVDNRQASRGTKQPAWKCSSSSCGGGNPKQDGKGNWPWATWDASFFTRRIPSGLPDDIDEVEEWLLERFNDPDIADYLNTVKTYCLKLADGSTASAQHLFDRAGEEAAEQLGDEPIPAEGWDTELASLVATAAFTLCLMEKGDEDDHGYLQGHSFA